MGCKRRRKARQKGRVERKKTETGRKERGGGKEKKKPQIIG